MNKIIKYGLIVIKDSKILINRKKGTELFLLPGGKPKKGESAEDCLVREIMEEHKSELIKSTINYIGKYEDKAANEAAIISIDVYKGEIKGEPIPSSEIEEQRWFGIDDNPEILSPVLRDQILLDLIKKGII